MKLNICRQRYTLYTPQSVTDEKAMAFFKLKIYDKIIRRKVNQNINKIEKKGSFVPFPRLRREWRNGAGSYMRYAVYAPIEIKNFSDQNFLKGPLKLGS